MKVKEKESKAAGLIFEKAIHKETIYRKISALLIAFGLYTSFIGISMGMLEFDDPPWIAIAIGAAVVIAEHFTQSRNAERIANCVLSVLCAITIIIWYSTIIDGIKLILNHLFTVSEKYQKYIYERFSIASNSENYNICITVAMAFICTALAVLSHFAAKQKSGLLVALIFLMTITAEIYYGIFPQLWTVVLFVSLGLCILHHRHVHEAVLSIILLTLVLTISFAVIAAYSGPNAFQSEFTEKIRDQLDEHIDQKSSNALKQRQKQRQEKIENIFFRDNKVSDNFDDTASKNFQPKYKTHFEGNRAGLAHKRLPWGWILIGIMLFSLLIWHLVRMHKAKERLKIFSSPDYSVAIDGMFRHSVRWLEFSGIKPDNSLFSQYSSRVSKMFSEEYGKKYSKAVQLWEEAVYSEHVMSVDDCACMRMFLEETAETVKEHAGAFMFFKIKYFHFL